MADPINTAMNGTDWNSDKEVRVTSKMERVRQRTLEIAHDIALASSIPMEEQQGRHKSPPPRRAQSSLGAIPANLFVEMTKTFQTQYQMVEKQTLDEIQEHVSLVENVNETITCGGGLPALYDRIEVDPYLFLATFLDHRLTAVLSLSGDSSNTLMFSVINLTRDETLMKRALSPAIINELNSVRVPADLFRKNSEATRLLTLCAKAFGQNIIAHAVQPAITAVVDGSAKDSSFEIDPIIEEDPKKRKTNLRLLCSMTADLLRRIIADLPTAFVSLCRVVSSLIEVRVRLPSSGQLRLNESLGEVPCAWMDRHL